jgi:hypothetical protein
MTNPRPSLEAISAINGINALVGLWLLGSPWALEFSVGDGDGAAALSATLIGACLFVLSIARVPDPLRSPNLSLISLLLGLWTLISPWILGFSDEVVPSASAILSGAITALFAWASTIMCRRIRQTSQQDQANP